MFATRDVFALLLSLFAVFYATSLSGVVSFHPAFVVNPSGGGGDGAFGYHDAHAWGHHGMRSGFDDPNLKSQNAKQTVTPVFFDLNGDGVKEMIVVVGSDISRKKPHPEIALVEMHARYDASGKSRKLSRSSADVIASHSGRGRRGASSLFGSAHDFTPVKTLVRVSLVTGGGVTGGFAERWNPVAIAAGRVLPGSSVGPSASNDTKTNTKTNTNRIKKSVVVVVTEGWHVLCFDHNLNLLWEHSLGGGGVGEDGNLSRNASPSEAVAFVTDEAMFVGDRGLVVIGARGGKVTSTRTSDDGTFDPLADELNLENSVHTHRGGKASGEGSGSSEKKQANHQTRESNQRGRHFDYYAFETGTGALRWKHESKDFHRDLHAMSEKTHPQHVLKLDAESVENSEGRHFGEASCREFRESFIHELPHLWDRVGDTKIAAAHFAHHKKSKKSSSRSSVTKKSDSRSFGDQKRFQKNGNAAARLAKSVFTAATSTGFVSVPAAKNPTTGSKQKRRDQKKNALVVFQEEGIEVLHIFSGRPLCKMLLPPHVLHCDIDGDGVVDHAGVSGEMGGDEHGDGAPRDEFGSAHRRSCWARVTSGTPAREVLWEGSVCRGSFSGVARTGAAFGAGSNPSDAGFSGGTSVGAFSAEKTHGGFVTGNAVAVAAPALVLREVLEKRKRKKRNAIKDLVFLNSRGDVTSFSPSGLRRWQQRTDSGWAIGGGTVPSLKTVPLRAVRERQTGKSDASDEKRGAAEVVLAVGTTRATFLTPAGYKLTTLNLPSAPTASVQVVDVNNDGLNDVIVQTADGNVYCYYQQSRLGTKPFSALCGVLVITVGVTFVARVANARRRGYGYLVRSTERRDDGEGRKDR